MLKLARINLAGCARDYRCRGNTWFVPYETIKNRANQRPHPATFPVQLAERCIKLHGCCSELIVLDPFLGIGNAAVAAQRCGVERFVGIELDREYLNIAAQRIAERQTGQARELGALV